MWSWFLFLPFLTLLLGLGSWQCQRGFEKRSIAEHMERMAAAPAVAMKPEQPAPEAGSARHLLLRGHLEPERTVLLDNQSRNGQPGYHVWIPLRLGGGALALVDRGWVPANPRREDLPALDLPPEWSGPEVELSGLWRSLPRPGFRLGAPDCSSGPWPRRLQYPDVQQLGCVYGEPVLDGVLLLDPDAKGGFVREWSIATAIPPERHFGYALQWYALAVTLMFLFVKLNWR